MPGISASDRSRAKALIEGVNRLVERVGLISLPSRADLSDNVTAIAEPMRNREALRILHSVTVGALEPFGVAKSSDLLQAFPTIGHVIESETSDIEHALSAGRAKKVEEAANAIYLEAHKLIPCVIDEMAPTAEQTALIRSVVLYGRLDPLIKVLNDLRSSATDLSNDLDKIKPATSFARSLFTGRKRSDKVLDALADMEKRHESLCDCASKLECDIAAAEALTDDDVWSIYVGDRVRHNNQIRKLTGMNVDAPMPCATEELALEAEGLNGRLAKAIKVLDGITIPDEKAERDALKQLVHTQREREAQERLSGIDIDILANGGVRVGPFKSAGYHNLGQLLEKSARTLAWNKRITYQMATGVMRAVNEIYQSAYDSARCRLDAEKRPAQQDALVLELCRSTLTPGLRVERKDIKRKLDDLYRKTDVLRPLSGYAGNLAMVDSRRVEFSQQLTTLKAALPDLEKRVKALGAGFKRASSLKPAEAWDDFSRNAASYYARIESLGGGGAVTVGDLPKTLADKVAKFRLDTSLMRATLRGYQKFGAQYALTQEKTLIGDEMGLGKTVEAIAVMAHLAAGEETHFMVVCPLSVLINWVREVPTHSKLWSIGIHGKDRDAAFARWCRIGGVAVTTYETVSRLDWPRLEGRRIGAAVVDEAHYIKNPSAKRTEAVTSKVIPRSDRVIFLTGTPLENRVDEMNTLLSFLNPDLVRDKLLGMTIVNPIAYREAIAPVYLRRKRSDVLDELPKKVEKNDWCALSSADRRDYIDALDEGNFSSLRRVGWRHGDLDKSAKAVRLKEICEEAKSNGSKVLVFSYFLDTLAKVEQLCGDECAGVISGRIPAAKRQQMIDEFSRSSRTVLVSQVTAGGVGLNIQAANIVVFCEPQLKPSVEDQATSRSYRMGQVRTVVVHRLLMSDAIDERIEEILARKRAEFDAYADKSQAGQESLGVVDTASIIEMIEAERERYKVRSSKAINAKSSSGDE